VTHTGFFFNFRGGDQKKIKKENAPVPRFIFISQGGRKKPTKKEERERCKGREGKKRGKGGGGNIVVILSIPRPKKPPLRSRSHEEKEKREGWLPSSFLFMHA